MKKILLLGVLTFLVSYSACAQDGLINLESMYTVQETADRFETAAKENGLTIFVRINHQNNAASVNMELRPTEVIIFGNPKVGTPLMQCAQEVGIDLPQKVLIFEDENEKVWLSYNNPDYLNKRHNIKGCDSVLSKIAGVLSKLSAAAVEAP
jgi:uncharacterized protein (DUF302 family)